MSITGKRLLYDNGVSFVSHYRSLRSEVRQDSLYKRWTSTGHTGIEDRGHEASKRIGRVASVVSSYVITAITGSNSTGKRARTRIEASTSQKVIEFELFRTRLEAKVEGGGCFKILMRCGAVIFSHA